MTDIDALIYECLSRTNSGFGLCRSQAIDLLDALTAERAALDLASTGRNDADADLLNDPAKALKARSLDREKVAEIIDPDAYYWMATDRASFLRIQSAYNRADQIISMLDR